MEETPQRGEIRQIRETRYYIQGPPERPWEFTSPHVKAIEVEGRYVGMRYHLPVADVLGWELVSAPTTEPAQRTG